MQPHAPELLPTGLALRKAALGDVATIVAFQVAMALETEGLALDAATVTRGVTRPLTAPHVADYYVATLPRAAFDALEATSGSADAAKTEATAPVEAAPAPAVGAAPMPINEDPSGHVVVGTLMITFEWSDWRAGDMWWIESVFVRPCARRRGVFTALYRHVEALANADDSVAGLRLYVEDDNASAMAAYERLGMRVEHYRMMEAPKGGF